MLVQTRTRLVALLLLVVLVLGLTIQTATAADSSAIDLTDQPVVTGSGLSPNILVAVDNSGSMDFETLFSTTEGELYVSGSTPYTNNAGQLASPNNRESGNYIRYAYLFPNGYRYQYRNVNRYAVGAGGMLYPTDYPVPPTIQFAFARSSEYNKAYFDPATQYRPWAATDSTTYPNLNTQNLWQSAPYDPTQDAGTLNLTQPLRQTGDGYEFYFTRYMDASYVTYYDGRNWTKIGPARSNNDQFLAIQFYPATFYMPASWQPPAEFGWTGNYDKAHSDSSKADYEPAYGYDPSGNADLKRYKIIRGNFSSDGAYASAMTNFANWFTYYRKRNLAIRGGITSAFAKIGNVKVGSCSINTAEQRSHSGDFTELKMNDLSDSGQRSAFYSSIYGLDFYQSLGTPNRPALYYLGRELEENTGIITSPCQQNYAILFTDGFNSGQVNGIGNVDGAYKSDNAAIPDSYSNTIADIAMHFYKNLTLPSSVPSSARLQVPGGCPGDPSLDCESKPHMSTFGVTLGQNGVIFGNLQKYAKQNANPYEYPPPWYLDQDRHQFNSTELPVGGIQEIDDLWHATINTRGALLNASSPQEIADEFTTTLNQILGRGETLTHAAGNGTSLTTDSTVFQTQYSTTNWTGDLIAFNAQNGSTAESNRLWSAASELADIAKAGASDSRTIITALGNSNTSTADSNVSGVPFTAAGLSGAGYSSLTPNAINYLRGDRTLEQTGAGDDQSKRRIYRNRGDTVLGDIINSVPAYVGSPTPLRYAGTWQDDRYPDQSMPENSGQKYYAPGSASSFVSQYASRTPMVYVGANDGMLHGFDAATGAEKLAYIPNTFLGSLAGGDDPLTSPSYTHRSFVDGQIAAGPAYFDGQWHTMLVGGLRNGGNTVYGLDVTDPSQFSQANAAKLVKWEFHAPGLGKTFGTPSIVRLHACIAKCDRPSKHHWAAIFSNGYNSDDYGASLYVVDIADGHQIAHLTTGATPSGDQQGNGLATPFPVDIDGDHVTDYVYAGDLYGNVWRFDLTSSNPDAWSDQKIFQATAPGGSAQPITTQVQVAAHPNGVAYGVMIYFGTGQDIQPLADDDSTVPNSFYGIWDPDVISYDPGSGAPARPSNSTVDRSQLVTQSVSTIEPENGVDGLSYRTVSDDPITYINDDGEVEDRGWVIDLPEDSGEAILNPPTIVDDNVEFTTTVINRQTCSLTSSGYFMAVSRVNGGPAAEDIFDVNGDGVVDDKDATDQRVAGVGFGSESGSPGQGPSFNDLTNGTQVIKTPLTGGGTATITLARDFLSGRRSWHEIRR